MDGGLLGLGEIGRVEQIPTQCFPVRSERLIAELAALDEHPDHVEDFTEQFIGGAIGTRGQTAGLLEEVLGDAVSIPVDGRAVGRRRTALGKVTERERVHDVRERVELEPDRVTRIAHGGGGGVARDASRGVGAGGERIQGHDAGLAFPEESHRLRFVPGQQSAVSPLGALLHLPVQISGEQRRLAGLGRTPDRQGLAVGGGRSSRVGDSVEGIKPTSPGEDVIGVVLDATDAELPVPIERLGEFGRGKLEAQGHVAGLDISTSVSRSISVSNGPDKIDVSLIEPPS